MQGVVPPMKVAFQEFTLTGTDSDDLSASASFKITYQSKPYLNRALKNFQIRTDEYFQYTIPDDTFLHPDKDTITYVFYDTPSWLKFENKSMTFSGRPNATSVGTFIIIVNGTDTKNKSAITSFQIDV